jgi:hypothetical protein
MNWIRKAWAKLTGKKVYKYDLFIDGKKVGSFKRLSTIDIGIQDVEGGKAWKSSWSGTVTYQFTPPEVPETILFKGFITDKEE